MHSLARALPLDAPRLRFPFPELGRFGAAAAAAALRLHNRRLGGVLGRLGPRSSILGDYSASKAVCLCVCEQRNKQAPVVCGLLSYAVSRPLPPSRPFRGCPLPPEAIPRQPPRSSPPCLRAARCPPPNGPVLPRAKSEGRADFCARWRVRGAPPISPRAALSGAPFDGEELTAAGEIDQAAGQIDHPPDDAAGGLHEAAARAVEVARSTPHPEPPASASRVMLACPAVLIQCRRPHPKQTAPRSRLVHGWRLAVPRIHPRPKKHVPATRLRHPPAVPARRSSPPDRDAAARIRPNRGKKNSRSNPHDDQY